MLKLCFCAPPYYEDGYYSTLITNEKCGPPKSQTLISKISRLVRSPPLLFLTQWVMGDSRKHMIEIEKTVYFHF